MKIDLLLNFCKNQAVWSRRYINISLEKDCFCKSCQNQFCFEVFIAKKTIKRLSDGNQKTTNYILERSPNVNIFSRNQTNPSKQWRNNKLWTKETSEESVRARNCPLIIQCRRLKKPDFTFRMLGWKRMTFEKTFISEKFLLPENFAGEVKQVLLNHYQTESWNVSILWAFLALAE